MKSTPSHLWWDVDLGQRVPTNKCSFLRCLHLKQFVFAAAAPKWADVPSPHDRVFVKGGEGWSCILNICLPFLLLLSPVIKKWCLALAWMHSKKVFWCINFFFLLFSLDKWSSWCCIWKLPSYWHLLCILPKHRSNLGNWTHPLLLSKVDATSSNLLCLWIFFADYITQKVQAAIFVLFFFAGEL